MQLTKLALTGVNDNENTLMSYRACLLGSSSKLEGAMCLLCLTAGWSDSANDSHPGTTACHAILEQPRELGVAERNVLCPAFTEFINHGPKREQALVDEASLQRLPLVALCLKEQSIF